MGSFVSNSFLCRKRFEPTSTARFLKAPNSRIKAKKAPIWRTGRSGSLRWLLLQRQAYRHSIDNLILSEWSHDGHAYAKPYLLSNHVRFNGGHWVQLPTAIKNVDCHLIVFQMVQGQLLSSTAIRVGQKFGLWLCNEELQRVDGPEAISWRKYSPFLW